MKDSKLEHVYTEVNSKLEELQKLFEPFMKLTFVARNPEDDSCTIIVSNDVLMTLPGVINEFARRERLME